MKQVQASEINGKRKVTVMVKKATRVFALAPCAALLFGTLQASTVKSEKIEIPFAFSVQKHKILPAGLYQVEQATASDLASLVNTKTGERVQVLRPQTTHQQGKAHLVFENNAHGHSLKSIS
jgi:hypothetical protein